MKVLWIVNHGVDFSHLCNTEIFNTKKEAVLFVNENLERASRIVRWTDIDDKVIFENKVGITTIE